MAKPGNADIRLRWDDLTGREIASRARTVQDSGSDRGRRPRSLNTVEPQAGAVGKGSLGKQQGQAGSHDEDRRQRQEQLGRPGGDADREDAADRRRADRDTQLADEVDRRGRGADQLDLDRVLGDGDDQHHEAADAHARDRRWRRRCSQVLHVASRPARHTSAAELVREPISGAWRERPVLAVHRTVVVVETIIPMTSARSRAPDQAGFIDSTSWTMVGM